MGDRTVEHPRVTAKRYLALASEIKAKRHELNQKEAELHTLNKDLDVTEFQLSKCVGRSVQKRAFLFDSQALIVRHDDDEKAGIEIVDLE